MAAVRVRRLVVAVAAGQARFALSWLVAGGLSESYSHERQHVSELAARNAEHALIVSLGIAVLGLSWIGFGYVFLLGLLRMRWWRRIALIFALAGSARSLVAFLPLDCAASVDDACRARGEAWDLSWRHYAHVLLAWGAQIALAVTPFTIALALRATPLARPLVALGVLGLLFGAATTVVGFADEARAGIYQRAGLAVVHGWTCLLAAALFVAATQAGAHGDERAGRIGSS